MSGIETSGPGDKKTVADIAVTMLDTKRVPGYVLNPFDPNHSLKTNAVSKLPPDLYFLGIPSCIIAVNVLLHTSSLYLYCPHTLPVRTVQLLKGISFAFDLDFSLAQTWAPLARKTILQQETV